MDVTIIARRSDGMILCESWDTQSVEPKHVLTELRIQATDAIKRMHSAAEETRRLTVDLGKGVDLHILLKGLVVYAALCRQDRVPNKRLAFIYLEEIDSSFLNYLGRTFGSEHAVTNFSSQIQSVSKPFHFVTFDRNVSRIRIDYQDGRSDKASMKMKNSLVELNSIMKKTIGDLMLRGDTLEEVNSKARHLKDESEKFRKTSRWINTRMMLEQYAPIAGIIIALGIFVQLKFGLFF